MADRGYLDGVDLHELETQVTELVSVTGSKTYTQYGPPRQPGERRSYDQRPSLNGVVVRQWNNHIYTSPPVFVTNGPVEDAFAVLGDYDLRSLIENGVFREGKQPWNLEHAPMKTEAAVIVHVVFTLAVMAQATAYRLWSKQQELAQPEPAAPTFTLLEGEGSEAWRRRLQQENRDDWATRPQNAVCRWLCPPRRSYVAATEQ